MPGIASYLTLNVSVELFANIDLSLTVTVILFTPLTNVTIYLPSTGSITVSPDLTTTSYSESSATLNLISYRASLTGLSGLSTVITGAATSLSPETVKSSLTH